MIEEFIWEQKYRPKVLEQVILPSRIKSIFGEFVKKKQVPNMILFGPSGIGKSTVARAVLDEIDADYLFINASLDRNIDTLRGDISQFATTVSFKGGKKYVILDEADFLNANTFQPALRSFIDSFSKNCGFISTCNYPNRILPALHSRCTLIDFKILSSEKVELASKFYKRICEILQIENISYDRTAVAGFVSKWFPDFRRVLNEVQKYSASGKIDSGILSNTNTDLKELIPYLKEQDFTKTRKWVGENSAIDINEFYTTLYNVLPALLSNSGKPQAILLLAKYQYESSFSANIEINMAACLTHLMLTLKGEWI